MPVPPTHPSWQSAFWPAFFTQFGSDDLETDPGEYYLDSLAVHPDYRRMGIGRALRHRLPSDALYSLTSQLVQTLSNRAKTEIMKHIIILFSILSVLSCGSSKKAVLVEHSSIEDNPEFVSMTNLIISYDTEIGKEPLLAAIKEYKAEILYDYSIITAIAIKIPEGADIHDAIDYFKKVKGVTAVERDHIYHLTDPVKPNLEVM